MQGEGVRAAFHVVSANAVFTSALEDKLEFLKRPFLVDAKNFFFCLAYAPSP